jgi:NitT/TauT family transport system substrate-binding protein
MTMGVTLRATLALLWILVLPQAGAGEPIRIALLKFGTVSWEIDVVRHHKLDEKNGIRLDITELASTQATTVALQAGSTDMIVTDWVWVSRQRGTGADFAMLPYSSALGAVMVAPGSTARTLADLKGKRLGVAGGPLDKSWLMLRAFAGRTLGFDPQAEAEPVYGAPPLLGEKLRQGELDAVLTYWHFAARLEALGFRRLIGMDEVVRALGVNGSLPMVGYTFSEAWAARNREAVDGFSRAVSEARRIMAASDAEWRRLAPLTQAESAEALRFLMMRYREGIPENSGNILADSEKILGILAGLGGTEAAGGQGGLAPGTFWGIGR